MTEHLRVDRAWRLVWRAAPGWTLVNLMLVVVQGLLPLAGLYLMKRIVDAVAGAVASLGGAASFEPVAIWILLAGAVALLTAVCRSLGEVASEAQGMVVTDSISNILHAQSVAVDLEYYENPAYYDTLHRAQAEATYRPTRIVNGLVQMGQSSLSLLGIGALLFSFNWLIGVVLFFAAFPAAIARLVYSRRLYRLQEKQTASERRAWYYQWMITSPSHAKEIRLFSLGPLFQRWYCELRQQIRGGRLALSRRRALNDLFAQSVATVAIFGTFTFVAYQAVNGTITLGSLVIYYQGFQTGLGFLQSILRGIAGLYEDNLFLTNFYKFLELQPKVHAPDHPQPVPSPFRQGLSFEGVGFAYPGTAREVLTGIDLTLAPGEVIALVGENGSGKTTLIKLLCRLYDPDQGRITLDGLDLRELDPIRWRREIGVIFQDYVHYHMKVWENIWLGDAEKAPDRATIEAAGQRSGADGVIARLPQGYDTPLGNWLDQGQELSTGEWQKIALARAFLRDARIVVLDEPTSSLDPLAEAEVFRQFRRLMEGRSAILISHRFSTVQMADRIYVLHEGRIVERGSHRELIERNGRYARLYRAQAESYQLSAVGA